MKTNPTPTNLQRDNPPTETVSDYKNKEDSMKAQFTDRYQAMGIPYPDPETMCKGQCEGTGYVPHKPARLYKDNECRPIEDPSDAIFDKLWEEAEKVKPTDDGYHFVKCPDCDGTGKTKVEPTVEKCHTCHKPLITDWHEGDCIKCARDKVDKKAHCKKHNLNHGLKYKSCRI